MMSWVVRPWMNSNQHWNARWCWSSMISEAWIILVQFCVQRMHFVRSSLSLWYHSLSTSPGNTQTALGRRHSVESKYFEDVTVALRELKKTDTYSLQLNRRKGEYHWHNSNLLPAEKYAYVLGHEMNGVSEKALALCDLAIEIPQEGTEALNQRRCLYGNCGVGFCFEEYRVMVGCWLLVGGWWLLVDGC